MPVARRPVAHKIIAGLVLAAVGICGAGLRHQQAQQDASVEWNDVSVALMEVERAKRDLHQSMQQRLAKEQQNTHSGQK